MKYLAKSRNFWIVLAGDLVLLTLAYLLSFIIRFETFEVSGRTLSFNLFHILPFVLIAKVVVFYLFGLYRGVWRYMGVYDLLNIIKGTLLSSALIVILFSYVLRIANFPRGVLAIDCLLTLVFVGGFRLLIRIYLSPSFFPLRGWNFFNFSQKPPSSSNLLILGAGDSGEKILREIRNNPHLPYRVIGFLDDDIRKRGLWIHGLPVLGKIDELPHVVRDRRIQEVLIAIPSSNSRQMRRIVDLCRKAEVRSKTIPSLGDLINGTVSLKEIRDVSYEDLLGREPVRLEESVISACLGGKRILVTGAGGSIGAELCRQIARFSPELLVCFERAENALFHLETRILRDIPNLSYKNYIGDILDDYRISEVFKKTNPHVVFHAAAYKHVPLMEQNPVEAIRNNILGTEKVAMMADRSGVERFVLISTDKAVDPVSIMGATKRVAELLIQGLPQVGSGKFMTVRFGNVVGSEGSVVPLFQAQIAKGGPITVTHPEATRFFMSIPEATQLILQAASLGHGGEIFLLDMGDPVRIVEMAEDLIRLSGKEPHHDIDIVFTGLRPGEKLHEQLTTEDENALPTPHPKIRILRPSPVDKREIFDGISQINQLIAAANGDPYSTMGLLLKLREIIPEYKNGLEILGDLGVAPAMSKRL